MRLLADHVDDAVGGRIGLVVRVHLRGHAAAKQAAAERSDNDEGSETQRKQKSSITTHRSIVRRSGERAGAS